MSGRTAWLQTGFRPFFLLGSFHASLTLAFWLLVLAWRWPIPGDWPAIHWHSHELIFGFAAAAIAGFLLTAVPTWTNTARFRGAPLAVLVAIWGAGRVVIWAAVLLPAGLVAAVDLLFFPLLAGAVGTPILRSRQSRNYPVLGILLLLMLANLAVHLQMLGLAHASARPALRSALFLVVLLVTIIAGRIVPLFTSNALRREGRDARLKSHPRLEVALIATLVAAVLLDLTREASLPSALAHGLASALLLLRQLAWRPWLTRDQPILWILHVGHAWLVLGFALRGLAFLTGAIPPSAALHAFSAGVIGSMVLAVMSRVSLGHTGRELVVSKTTLLAYLLVIAGGLLRVFAPLAGPQVYLPLLLLAGGLWSLAYLVFCLHHWPILRGARVDGQPG